MHVSLSSPIYVTHATCPLRVHLRASRCAERTQAVDHHRWVVTQEGREYIQGGTPEARVWDAAGGEGIPLAELKVRQKHSRIWGKAAKFLMRLSPLLRVADQARRGYCGCRVQAGHGAEGCEVEQRRRACGCATGESTPDCAHSTHTRSDTHGLCVSLQVDAFEDTVRQQLTAVDQGQVCRQSTLRSSELLTE